MPQDNRILITGAGIGGLTAALSLHQAGFAVDVYEAVPDIKPLGVGLNMLPHAVRELDEIGLRADVERAGVSCRELAYFTKRGERIWAEPRGLAAGYRWPQVSIHRGRLQMILLAAAQQRLGTEHIHLGRPVVDVQANPGQGVRLRFADRATGQELGAAEGRLLIACDGIHSTIRKMFYPNEGPPCWNGAIMWRGVAEFDPVLDGHTMIMAGHPETKFVCYPIGNATPAPGKQIINFIAERRFTNSVLAEREDWNRPGQLEDFLPAFEAFRFPWLDVPALIRAAAGTWVFPMVDRDPLPRWTHGPVTLLGDAAHPMYPVGSNGASQAILDARVLTGCLRHYTRDPERALQRYEELRLPATANVVLANRRQGPEASMQLVEKRAPNGFARLEDVVSAAELKAITDQYKKLAGFAVAELNARGSLAEPTP
jgi:5-methylphenazine-1-carboxylate 1-monooxygenase